MNKAMTITADTKTGEVAYFSVIPSGSIEKFLNDVEWISDVDDVIELEKEGCFTIV